MLTSPEAKGLWPTLNPVAAAPSIGSGFPELATTSRKKLDESFGVAAAPATNRTRNIHVSECESIDELTVDEIDEEMEARPPEFRPDYGAAIAHALDQQALLNAFSGDGSVGNNVGGNGGAQKESSKTKKKKKKGSTVLFTTCVRSYDGN